MKYYDIDTNGFYEEAAEGRVEISDETWQELLENQSKGGEIKVINGSVTCVLPTDEELIILGKVSQKANLLAQVEAIDKKSIRALREGGIKDETTGQTWVEYYTAQIVALRNEIASL